MEWLARYHCDYETLSRLDTLPESEREAEYERRNAIRHELLALPDAPKTIQQTQAERIKSELRTTLGFRCLTENRFPDHDRLWNWIQSDCDQRMIPDFEDDSLNRLANDLRIALLATEIRAEALAMVVPTDPVVGKPAGRRGRLPKSESKALKTNMLAHLREHPTLADDPKKLAGLVGLSEATARRLIDSEREKFNELNRRE